STASRRRSPRSFAARSPPAARSRPAGAARASTRSRTAIWSTGSRSSCAGNASTSSSAAGARPTASRPRAISSPAALPSASCCLPFGCGLRPCGEPAVERVLEHLVDVVGEHELELVARLSGELGEIGLVLPRENHLLEAGPLCGEHLLADAADLENLAGERDLAGHADLG